MHRLASLIAIVAVSSAAVHAQDRLIQLGWLWELSGAELTRLRPMPIVPDYPSAVVVSGSRYLLAPVPYGPGTAAIGYLDVVAGTVGLVPGISLEMPESGLSRSVPGVAADPRRPRVFIWHGSRISAFSASAGLQDIISGIPERPYFSKRHLAYSAGADVVTFVLSSETHADTDEIVVARATTGEEVRRVPLGGRVSQLAADPVSSRLVLTLQPRPGFLDATVLVLDLPDGALTTLPYAPPSSLSGLTVDSTNHRLLFSGAGGVLATDDRGVVLGELHTGTGGRQITVVAGVSAATGRTFVHSSFGGGTYVPPGPCLLHVVERSGAHGPPVDLSARIGRHDGRCEFGTLLTPPGSPGTPAAVVTGRRVAVSWTHPGNVEAFELEVRIGAAVLVWPAGADAAITFENVPSGAYGVRVRGRNAVGVGAWSALTSVAVP